MLLQGFLRLWHRQAITMLRPTSSPESIGLGAWGRCSEGGGGSAASSPEEVPTGSRTGDVTFKDLTKVMMEKWSYFFGEVDPRAFEDRKRMKSLLGIQIRGALDEGQCGLEAN
jgi:hypothetical protein